MKYLLLIITTVFALTDSAQFIFTPKKPVKTSPALERLMLAFRKEVSFNDADRVLHVDMVKSEQFLNQDADAIIQ